jgi:hypothetical protein
LEALEFLQRIPVGIYSFSILIPTEDGNALEKNCEVLVFDHIQQAYDSFINGLEQLFNEVGYAELENLTDEQLDTLLEVVVAEYFDGYDNVLPGYRDDDLKDILRYYAQQGLLPTFLEFKDRNKCDLAKEARYIYDHSLGGKAKTDYIDSLWNDENSFWRVLFGHKKEYFIRQLSIEEEKIAWPRKIEEPQKPWIEYDKVEISKLPLHEIMKRDRVYWRKLRQDVFARHTNSVGLITCACCGFASKSKISFQIDHIVPISKGGLSEISNLQILCRKCNAIKGDQIINFQNIKTTPTAPPAAFPNFKPPQNPGSREEWQEFLRRAINDFYGCAAVKAVTIHFLEWHIELHPGNNLLRLRPHLKELIKEINCVRAGLQEIEGIRVSAPDQSDVVVTVEPPVTEEKPKSPVLTVKQEKKAPRGKRALPTDGTVCRFRYKNRLFEGKITGGKFVIPGRGTFTSFSAASDTLTGTQRNGWLDWELQLPGTKEWILADKWRKN